jgi:mono/diheme cytochrome c family protein
MHASALLIAISLPLLAGCNPAVERADPVLHQSFDAALIARGAQLAAIGDCHGCHTTAEGAPFAGGVAMHSPFGTIYSTNITPDRDTGIGRWSEDAFGRALREGIARDGSHLYPAFPYDRFARLTDEDVHALYAYIMSRPAVEARAPKNELTFPFNLRSGIGLWKAMYLHGAPHGPGVSDPLVARGEYLVEGLGHCGSCHSPRNALYAEKRDEAYDGGDLEGWHAYAINTKNKAPIPWDVEAMAFYLRNGWHPLHGIARGTMGSVTAGLARADPADVRAMAAYVVSLMGRASPQRAQRGAQLEDAPLARVRDADARSAGAQVYRTACVSCHDGREGLPFGGLPLTLSLGLHGESPRNLINVVLHGLGPTEDETGPVMPGYAGALDEAQVIALVAWLRANLTDEPAWPDFRKLIEESRRMDPSMLMFPPGGAGTDPRVARAP